MDYWEFHRKAAVEMLLMLIEMIEISQDVFEQATVCNIWLLCQKCVAVVHVSLTSITDFHL